MSEPIETGALPISELRAHADLGLAPATDQAMLARLRAQLDSDGDENVRPAAWRSWPMTTPLALRVTAIAGAFALVVSLAVTLGLTGRSSPASAAPLFSVLRQAASGMSPAQEQILKQAQATQPDLEIAAARQVLSDANGTLWLVPAGNGAVCVVQQPTAAGARIPVPGRPAITLIGPLVSCANQTQAASRGVFIGTPGLGRWYYGVAPDHITNVQAVVNNRAVPLNLTNGGFRVPPAATMLTVGNLRIYSVHRPVGQPTEPPHHIAAPPLRLNHHG